MPTGASLAGVTPTARRAACAIPCLGSVSAGKGPEDFSATPAENTSTGQTPPAARPVTATRRGPSPGVSAILRRDRAAAGPTLEGSSATNVRRDPSSCSKRILSSACPVTVTRPGQ